MKALVTTVIILIASLGYAQSTGETSGNNDKIKEVPAAAVHGKAVSELAKTTPGGPDKGKIINSAARQQGLQKGQGMPAAENKPGNQYGNRPEHAGKPEVSGKPSGVPSAQGPRTVPSAKPRPAGIHGRN